MNDLELRTVRKSRKTTVTVQKYSVLETKSTINITLAASI